MEWLIYLLLALATALSGGAPVQAGEYTIWYVRHTDEGQVILTGYTTEFFTFDTAQPDGATHWTALPPAPAQHVGAARITAVEIAPSWGPDPSARGAPVSYPVVGGGFRADGWYVLRLRAP